MKLVVTILLIFLVQCAYLRPEPDMMDDLGKFFGSDSCNFTIESVSILMSNSISTGKNISEQEICSSIGPSKQIAFIIHGFISSAKTTEMRELSTRLTEKGYTVFAMDWSQGACTNGMPILKLTGYSKAVQNTREIGQLVAREYVYILVKKCNIPLENIMFIGHSLGAHVAGFAAKEIQKLSNKKVPLIIAADPASPLFSDKKCDERLCKADAERLNVLHTSGLGLSESLGHLDLQVNNGGMQPGCGVNGACSHTRSIKYISKMIGECGFLGVPIEKKLSIFEREPPYPNSNTTDCIFMSTNILDKECPITGLYYVFVEKKDPYCTRDALNCKQ